MSSPETITMSGNQKSTSTATSTGFSVFNPSRASDTPVAVGIAECGGINSNGGSSIARWADNRMYNELYEAVTAEERAKRVARGLPPDPPSSWDRFKNKMLGRTEEEVVRRKSESAEAKRAAAESKLITAGARSEEVDAKEIEAYGKSDGIVR